MTPIIYVDKCESTNSDIEKFIIQNQSDFLTLYTFHQTQGKGQYGNSWETAENINLAFTISVSEHLIKLGNVLFNFHTAALVADFFANLTNEHVHIKWPNDIIIRGKKIAGLLLEKKKIGGQFYFVIGIGVNVLQENFQGLPKAGSLWTQTKQKFDLHQIANELHDFLVAKLTVPISEDVIWNNLNENLFRKDLISVFELDGVRQNGIIRKVQENGLLCVEFENEILQNFNHKEIELLY
ncbi:biotin--[acetyl-CoA-carboxylase] ligase [Chryseobacterium sp. MP_3.2]|uniref:biotin--[acetyl-CoA-carboxylase] ligase n=1 Tax=Chryseobacterium sp. MP_3.2 TaxID=3071712 RepID=UPI002E061941|nr:BirA family biotin operon repressor/biotin-[acetyl-CoA-carboxylase] ligase [Chryseobacterium sp. MP_3.2]